MKKKSTQTKTADYIYLFRYSSLAPSPANSDRLAQWVPTDRPIVFLAGQNSDYHDRLRVAAAAMVEIVNRVCEDVFYKFSSKRTQSKREKGQNVCACINFNWFHIYIFRTGMCVYV